MFWKVCGVLVIALQAVMVWQLVVISGEVRLAKGWAMQANVNAGYAAADARWLVERRR